MNSSLLPLGIVIIETLLPACSEKEIRIDPATQGMLATQQEIAAIHYPPAPFTAQTPEVRNAASAGMLFGAVGGAISGAVQASEAKQAGSQLVKDYGLEDPILKIKTSFLAAVSRSSNLHNLNSVQEALPDDDLVSLKRNFRQGFIFDFKTTAWSLNPAGPLSPNNYRVHYAGRARLIRFPEGKIEWQGVCEADAKIEDSAPTLLQLVANSGAILKSQLNSASDACLEQLELQFMGTKP